jgi:hypothetical protein
MSLPETEHFPFPPEKKVQSEYSYENTCGGKVNPKSVRGTI